MGAACLIMLATEHAQAQFAWEARPRIAVGVLYEDNPRIRRDDKQDALGARIDARADLSAWTERTRLDLTPRIRSSWYTASRNEDLEDDDLFLDFRGSHRLIRSSLALDAGARRVSLRSSEFPAAIPDDIDDPPPEGDTGDTILLDRFREDWFVAPSWNWSISPRNQLALSGRYTEVRFDEDDRIASGRTNYDFMSGSVRWDFTLDPRNRFSLSFSATDFEAEGSQIVLESSSNTYGINASYQRSLSPTWSATISAGATEVRSDQLLLLTCPVEIAPGLIVPVPCEQELSGEQTNFIGSLTLRRRGELNNVTLDISRAISPNAVGTEVVRDTFRLFFDRQFTQLLNGSFGILVFDEESVGPFARRDRIFVRTEAGLRWRFAEHWSLRGSYTFFWDRDELDVARRSVTSNRAFVGIEYRGLGRGRR